MMSCINLDFTKMDEYAGFISQCLKFAVEIAKESGDLARTGTGTSGLSEVQTKLNSSDIVTEMDRKVERFIIDSIRKKYPTHKFIGEESSIGPCVLTDDPTWIIDPIDGTTNYVHGIPFSAVCIALAVRKEIVVGTIYNFSLDQMFSAAKGGGAYLNGKPIHVSSCKNKNLALVITDVGALRAEPDLGHKVSTVRDLASEACHVQGIRTIGSAALSCCMVAQGVADAYIEYEVHCWDYAAGDIIVREAGGVALYPTGGPLDLMGRGVLVASSKELAEEMIPFIHHCNYPRDDQ